MITLQHLHHSIDENVIINDLSLSITNNVTVIVGRSGSSKSQLLKQIIAGNDSITSTNIKYGYMPQNIDLFPWYSIEQNLKIVNRFNIDINIYLNDFKLSHLKKRYPHELSGGEQSRIALLRAFIMSDEYVLLDEPFSKLDYITHQEILHWLKDILKNQNKKIILVTHNLDEAILLADQIIVLKKHGELSKIIDKPFSNNLKDKIINEYI